MKMQDSVEVEFDETKASPDVLTSCKFAVLQAKETVLNRITSRVKECFMSHSRLLNAVKLILLVQYLVFALFSYHISHESKIAASDIKCRLEEDADLNGGNETLRSLLSTICFNEKYNARFARVFLSLEIVPLTILLVKLIAGMQNSVIKENLRSQVSDKLFFAVAAVTKCIILVIPFSHIKIPSTGAFLSLLLLPLAFIFKLLIRLITLPVSVFLLHPVKDKASISLHSIASLFGNMEKQAIIESHLDAKREISCYQICDTGFSVSWNFVICYQFICYSIAFWFVHISQAFEETCETYDVKENVSESVEFIRVSEVSEDFNYDDLSEEKVNSAGNFEALDEFVPEQENRPILVSEDEDKLSTNCEVLDHTGSSPVEFLEPCLSSSLNIPSHVCPALAEVVEKLDKECQTITPIDEGLKDKAKDKINVESAPSEVIKKCKDKPNVKSESFSVTDFKNTSNSNKKEDLVNLVNEIKETPPCAAVRDKQINLSSFPAVSKPRREVQSLPAQGESTHLKDQSKFSFSELSILPPDLDVEERIKQKSLMPQVSVDTFLSQLQHEQDKHQIYIEKELLTKMLKDIVLTARVTGISDCDFCPITKELTRECTCQIHVLIKSFTKGASSENDQVDGIVMNTHNFDDSDDESFFDGFRL